METQIYAAPANATVATTSTSVIAENARRRSLILTNDSAALVYLGVGAAAVMNKGLRIEVSGGVVKFGGETGLPLTTQAINGIVASGTSVVLVAEAT